MTQQEFEEWLDKQPLITFSHEIFYKGIENLVQTILDHCTLCETYHLDGSLQCPSGKRRSVTDVYLIAKSYKPDLTFGEYFRSFRRSDIIGDFAYCNAIRKTTFTAHHYYVSDNMENYILEVDKGRGKLWHEVPISFNQLYEWYCSLPTREADS